MATALFAAMTRMNRILLHVTASIAVGCTVATAAFAQQDAMTSKPILYAGDIVGDWGLVAFHRERDRPRAEAMAGTQCDHPFPVSRSDTADVLMFNHDSPDMQHMKIKVDREGKTYIGPGPVPAGPDDREVVEYSGHVLVLKWVDPEIAGRYGIYVLVRCPPTS